MCYIWHDNQDSTCHVRVANPSMSSSQGAVAHHGPDFAWSTSSVVEQAARRAGRAVLRRIGRMTKSSLGMVKRWSRLNSGRAHGSLHFTGTQQIQTSSAAISSTKGIAQSALGRPSAYRSGAGLRGRRLHCELFSDSGGASLACSKLHGRSGRYLVRQRREIQRQGPRR